VQDKLIKAAQPKDKTLDQKKKFVPGCIVIHHSTKRMHTAYSWNDCDDSFFLLEDGCWYGAEDFKIIGLPPTLSRVLHAFSKKDIRFSVSDNFINIYEIGYGVDWKFLNEDGTDATYFDQSEQTKKAIAMLLGWEKE